MIKQIINFFKKYIKYISGNKDPFEDIRYRDTVKCQLPSTEKNFQKIFEILDNSPTEFSYNNFPRKEKIKKFLEQIDNE